MNGLYRRAGLDIGTGEEYYPSLAPEKIPLLGRLFKASNIAFESGAMRLRADIFDKYVGIAREGGVDLSNDLEVRSIGKLVNTLTGRGSLGPLEKIGKTVNVVLFSPKFLASNVEFLTAHLVSFDAKMSPFARKQAAVNLMKVTAGLAGVAIIANAIFPGCVEYDPRSSDFMKIRIGNTRFDISGGMASVITLAARLTTLSTKNARGQVRPLNEKGYGKRSALDVFVDFMAGKASPAFAPVVDYLRGSTFGGKPVTLVGEVENVFVPFPITNVQELLTTPGGANPLLGEAADALGISVNTYQ